MAMFSSGPLLDPMMRELDISLSQGGIINAGLFLGTVIGVVILNTTMARVPLKWTLVGGTVLQGGAFVVAGTTSRDLWSLSLSYLIVGLGAALTNATCWIWLSAHMKKHRAASALQMNAFFALAMIVIPPGIGLAMDMGTTWRRMLIAEGVFSLVLALVFAFLPFLDVPGRQGIWSSQFKRVARHNGGLLLGMTGAGFMYVGALSTLSVWLPKFQIDVLGSSDFWASLAVTLFWVGWVLGVLAVVPLTRRFAPSRLLLVCACTLAAFSIAMGFASSRVTALLLSVGAGLGASGSYGIIGSYAGCFPGWQSGVASSLFVLSGGVGGVAFPYLIGPLASSAGFRIAIAAVSIPALGYALLSLLIHSCSEESLK